MGTPTANGLVQMNVRVYDAQKRAVDQARAQSGISRDEYVRRALTAALRAEQAARQAPSDRPRRP